MAGSRSGISAGRGGAAALAVLAALAALALAPAVRAEEAPAAASARQFASMAEMHRYMEAAAARNASVEFVVVYAAAAYDLAPTGWLDELGAGLWNSTCRAGAGCERPLADVLGGGAAWGLDGTGWGVDMGDGTFLEFLVMATPKLLYVKSGQTPETYSGASDGRYIRHWLLDRKRNRRRYYHTIRQTDPA